MKKLSNDTMFKLVFSDEEIMIWFLEKILKRKIKSVDIIQWSRWKAYYRTKYYRIN